MSGWRAGPEELQASLRLVERGLTGTTNEEHRALQEEVASYYKTPLFPRCMSQLFVESGDCGDGDMVMKLMVGDGGDGDGHVVGGR